MEHIVTQATTVIAVIVLVDVEAAARDAVADAEVAVETNNLPKKFTFQWHITDQCNLRCKHCYQDEYIFGGVDYQSQITILNRLEMFVRQGGMGKAHINFTGGEPFLRKDFLNLLKEVKQRDIFSFGILSNGYLLDDEQLEQLQLLKPKFIQVSLEGKQSTNDAIRGKGNYNTVIKALKKYGELGIATMISFTANAMNYREFPAVVKLVTKYGCKKVWTDRYLPQNKTDDLLLSKEQATDYFELLSKIVHKKKLFSNHKTVISTNRALQFTTCGGSPYNCSAGKSLLAILPNGDILPCRRLPKTIGNILTQDLMSIYKNSETIRDLNDETKLDENCASCYYAKSCFGGLKCLSYAVNGDYHRKDMHCTVMN